MSDSSDMNALRRALAGLEGEIVSLGGRAGARVTTLVHHLTFGTAVTDDSIMAAIAGDRETIRTARGPAMLPAKGGKHIAIVPMHGIALPKFEYPGLAYSTFGLAQIINALANDPTISAVILDIDSPGGAVCGTPEAADAVYNARQRKPVIAHINPLAASAAYWISSQASYSVIAQSGEAGALGCFVLHVEASRMIRAQGITATYIVSEQSPFKTEGNPLEKLTDAALAFEQKQVNTIGRQFIHEAARGRGVAASTVESSFGKGRVLSSGDSLRADLVDRVGTFEDAFRLAAAPATMRAARLAQFAQPREPRSPAMARQRRLEALR